MGKLQVLAFQFECFLLHGFLCMRSLAILRVMKWGGDGGVYKYVCMFIIYIVFFESSQLLQEARIWNYTGLTSIPGIKNPWVRYF